VASVAARVRVTLDCLNQLFVPSGLAGEVVSVVVGLTLSSLMWVVLVFSVLPALSTDQ
jgi:hypothetical protein